MDSLQVGSTVETRTLPVRREALTGYPSARSPSTGVLIGMDDANLTCIVGTFHTEFKCVYSTLLCKPFSYTVRTLTFHIASCNASSTALTHGRQRFSFGFFPGLTESCVLDEAEGHGRHEISVTTISVIGAAQVSAYLRVTLALTSN